MKKLEAQKKKPVIRLSPVQTYLGKELLFPVLENIEISESLEEFYSIRSHFLIFTEAGKPIFSRYGDEMILAPFFATMSAVIPKI